MNILIRKRSEGFHGYRRTGNGRCRRRIVGRWRRKRRSELRRQWRREVERGNRNVFPLTVITLSIRRCAIAVVRANVNVRFAMTFSFGAGRWGFSLTNFGEVWWRKRRSGASLMRRRRGRRRRRRSRWSGRRAIQAEENSHIAKLQGSRASWTSKVGDSSANSRKAEEVLELAAYFSITKNLTCFNRKKDGGSRRGKHRRS
jgi:hypothetical protein